MQEIANEDDERTTAFKILLTDYNKNYVEAITIDDKNDVKDKYDSDSEITGKKYNKPTVMKVPENIRFRKELKQGKKIAKITDKLHFDVKREYITDSDMFNNIETNKKKIYRYTKVEKEDELDKIEDYNEDMEIEILKRKISLKN